MMLPLIMPVSVPVHRMQPDTHGSWAPGRLGPGEQSVGQSERKPSVIVARRRSLRNSITESYEQVSIDDITLTMRPRPSEAGLRFYCSVVMEHTMN